MTNAESELTRVVRSRLEGYGCHFVKLSDRFTRGVLDSLVTSDRLVWVEFKVHVADGTVQTYQQLGLSGAQDHHIRQVVRRSRKAACCVTGARDGTSLALWLPVSADSELIPQYRLAADGDQVFIWICGASYDAA